MICHRESLEDAVPRRRELNDDVGNRYQWEKTFATAPLSGLHWFIFHNETPRGKPK
jgi:hypothetical protein